MGQEICLQIIAYLTWNCVVNASVPPTVHTREHPKSWGSGRTCMWVPDLGLALRVCPGMTPISGADCSAPGISPCPLR
eukprot:878468-Prymnesium_polylepis.1